MILFMRFNVVFISIILTGCSSRTLTPQPQPAIVADNSMIHGCSKPVSLSVVGNGKSAFLNQKVLWQVVAPDCSEPLVLTREGAQPTPFTTATFFERSYSVPGNVVETVTVSRAADPSQSATLSTSIEITGTVASFECTVLAVPAEFNVPVTVAGVPLGLVPPVTFSVTSTISTKLVSAELMPSITSSAQFDAAQASNLHVVSATGFANGVNVAFFTVVDAAKPANVASCHSIVTVNFVVPVPTANILANNQNLPYLGSVTLTWDAQNATSCSIKPDNVKNPPEFTVATSGTLEVLKLIYSTRYDLTCTGASGAQVTKSAMVNVNCPAVQSTNGSAVTSRTHPINDCGPGGSNFCTTNEFWTEPVVNPAALQLSGLPAEGYQVKIVVTSPGSFKYGVDSNGIDRRVACGEGAAGAAGAILRAMFQFTNDAKQVVAAGVATPNNTNALFVSHLTSAFIIPPGATRLYASFPDSYYGDNGGDDCTYTFHVRPLCAPL